MNSVNWLLGDVEAISVRPNDARASRLQLTREIVAQLRYLSLFVLPEAIAVLGVVVWWRRRRSAGAMNPRTTAILALLVAALGAFVWLYEIRGGEARSEEEAKKRVFRDVKADSID